MRAKQTGDVLVLELEGHLDFEATQQFQETCSELLVKNGNRGVVISLEKLRFVGSSGIGQFIQVLKGFNKAKRTKPKLCNLSSEFARMFKVHQTTRRPFDVYETEEQALASFEDTKRPTKRPPLDN